MFWEVLDERRSTLLKKIVSLVYFEDAEHEPPPECIANISWLEVKDFFNSQQPSLIEFIKKI